MESEEEVPQPVTASWGSFRPCILAVRLFVKEEQAAKKAEIAEVLRYLFSLDLPSAAVLGRVLRALGRLYNQKGVMPNLTV